MLAYNGIVRHDHRLHFGASLFPELCSSLLFEKETGYLFNPSNTVLSP